MGIVRDIMLDSDFESDDVDIDNNGAIDFTSSNSSYSWTNFCYSSIVRIFGGLIEHH